MSGIFAAHPATGWQHGFDRASVLVDPLPSSAEVIAAGRTTYRERCAACHGERGRGDGPAGAALDPKPADLVLHVPQHTDGELFYFVSLGVPGTAMPAWRSILTSTERWQLVRYLRTLARGAP